MKNVGKGLVVLTLILTCSACMYGQGTTKRRAQAGKVGPVAKVWRLTGKAFHDQGNKKPKDYLKPGRDVYPDWSLNCEGAGSLVLMYVDAEKVRITHRDPPYIVPHIVTDKGVLQSLETPITNFRGNTGRVFSPPQSEGILGSVWPSRLILRWAPFAPGTEIKLTIRSASVGRTVIWSRDIVEKADGGGIGDFADARVALEAFRNSKPGSLCEFLLEPSTGSTCSVLFSPLSSDEELRLQTKINDVSMHGDELDKTDHIELPRTDWTQAKRDNELILHVSKASVFQSTGLYSQASDELFAAFELAPNREDIWVGAVRASHRAGNHLQEKYLSDHMPSGASIPNDIRPLL